MWTRSGYCGNLCTCGQFLCKDNCVLSEDCFDWLPFRDNSRPFQVPGARPCTQGVVVYLKLQTTNKDLDALFDIDFFVCVVSSVNCDVAVFA